MKKLLRLIFGEPPQRDDIYALLAAQRIESGTADPRVAEAIDQILGAGQMPWTQVQTGLGKHGDPCVADHPENWKPTLDWMLAQGILRQTSRNFRLLRAAGRDARVAA